MLINLSNHSSQVWPKAQTKAAAIYGNIVDLPFPAIDPSIDSNAIFALTEEYCLKCSELLNKSTDKKNAVHIMGELTFTCTLVARLQKLNIICIASTTQRDISSENEEFKTSRFKFVRFREYPPICQE